MIFLEIIVTLIAFYLGNLIGLIVLTFTATYLKIKNFEVFNMVKFFTSYHLRYDEIAHGWNEFFITYGIMIPLYLPINGSINLYKEYIEMKYAKQKMKRKRILNKLL
jgi:hypothetical protein